LERRSGLLCQGDDEAAMSQPEAALGYTLLRQLRKVPIDCVGLSLPLAGRSWEGGYPTG
jgi:hypothetical protein